MLKIWFTCAFVISFGTLNAQSESSSALEASKQLQELDRQLGLLKEKKAMITDILQTTEEISLIVKNITYNYDQALFDSIPSLLNRIESAVTNQLKEDAILTLYRSILRLNRFNTDTYRPALEELNRLKKYTLPLMKEPTEAQKFRDLKLQELRLQILNRIESEYDGSHEMLPEIVYFNSLGNLDVQRTLSQSGTIRNKVNSVFLQDLTERVSVNDFEKLTNIFNGSIQSFKASINLEESQLDSQIKEQEKKYNNLLDKQNEIDNAVLDFLKYLMGFIILLFLIPLFYKKDEKAFRILFKRGLLLHLVTVFLLIVIILLLGITGRLQSDVIATLLGGISAYVLKDGIQNRGKKDKPSSDVSTTIVPDNSTPRIPPTDASDTTTDSGLVT